MMAMAIPCSTTRFPRWASRNIRVGQPCLIWGLRAGGLLLAGFAVALGLYVGQRAMMVVTLAGVVMAGGVVLVGYCPVTEPQCHQLGAQIVFISGVVTMLAFVVVLFMLDQDKLSKWLAVPSALAVLAFGLFIFMLYTQYENPQQAFIQCPPVQDRPRIWLPSLLEWLFFGTTVVWVVTISTSLWRQEQASDLLAYTEQADAVEGAIKS
jgi:hypothetical protein